MAGSAWTNQVQNVVIVAGPTGTVAGVFVYSGSPGLGNPPIAWLSASSKDPFGNTIQPGIMLAETAATGHAQGGLIWNTATPGTAIPLLALFPDSTLGFAGNSPFILGNVTNRGLASEALSLALGGGAASNTSSPTLLQLFGASKDGTTVLPHVSIYGATVTGQLIADFSANGLVAANPNSVNTLETWHAATGFGSGFSAGSPAPSYKFYPDNTVALGGLVNVTSGTTSGTVFTLPTGYRPLSNKKFALTFSAGTPATAGNLQATIGTTGTVQISAGPTGSAYNTSLDVCRFPLDF